MEIRYICEFVVLAKVGKFHEAAEMLFISQSTLSKHIKAIEQEFGASLFDRTPKKAELTELGKAFFPIAMQIDELHRSYRNLLVDFSTRAEPMNIAATPDTLIYSYVLRPLVKLFQQSGYQKVNVIEDTAENLLDKLWMKECDLVLIYNEPDSIDARFKQITLFQDELVCVVPTEHPLAARKKIEVSELKNEPLIMLRDGSFFRSMTMRLFEKAGFEPQIGLQLARYFSLIDSVHSGLGVALWSRYQANFHLKNAPDYFTVVEIEDTLAFAYDILYHKHSLNGRKIESNLLELKQFIDSGQHFHQESRSNGNDFQVLSKFHG